MEWYWALIIMFGGFVFLMITGMPIAFAFMAVCVVGALLFWGGSAGLEQLGMSFYSSIASFAFLPVPLFIMMGNIIFESGTGFKVVEAVEKLLGRMPGRLSVVSTCAGTLLGSMIGVSGASIAILGQTMYPEMVKRGYKKALTLGPIVICGTLATLIPPSSLAVFFGAIARVSIGKLLMSILMPGLLLAVLCIGYIIIRALLQPSLSPPYVVERVPFKDKIIAICRHILPTGIVIFAVIGSVFTGIATPTEAAALGVISCYILAAINKNLTFKMIKTSAISSIKVTVMVFIIIVASISFGRLLATSGAIDYIIEFATGLPVHPMVVLIITQIFVLILGCFIDPASIVMISVPLVIPLVTVFGYDTVWFSTLMILNLQLGLITPPFGLDVYTMKAIMPKDVTLGDVFKSSLPFCGLGYLVMILLWIFPPIATWLPSVMAK